MYCGNLQTCLRVCHNFHVSEVLPVCFVLIYTWKRALGCCSVVSILGSKPLDPYSIPGATMFDVRFILAASAFHLITLVPVCLIGLAKAKVTLSTHASIPSISLIGSTSICGSMISGSEAGM